MDESIPRYLDSPDYHARCKACGEMFMCPAEMYVYVCPDCLLTAISEWSEAGPARVARIRRTYGLDLAEQVKMFTVQGGVCAICRDRERTERYGIVVDHDHVSGEVRGMLCANCNAGLGMFNDSPKFMTRARDYLKRSSGKIPKAKRQKAKKKDARREWAIAGRIGPPPQ